MIATQNGNEYDLGVKRFRDQPTLDAFGKVVEIERRRRGLSQAELAALVVPPMQASRLGAVERGEREPGLSLILRLADGLDVRPAYLMEEMEAELRRREASAASTATR
jgi:transcriptional regulator with XRE-family HTH domain